MKKTLSNTIVVPARYSSQYAGHTKDYK